MFSLLLKVGNGFKETAVLLCKEPVGETLSPSSECFQ